MKILLTGGAGYIGSHVSLELLDKGHQVSIIDNLVNGSKKLLPVKADFLECDIEDEKKISKLLIYLYDFFKFYNNNYRPIYHLEKILLYISALVNELL